MVWVSMAGHVIIDGNNLLYAMHAHAPLPPVGRETLVQMVGRWASHRPERVTLVFDGPKPREGLAKQMTSRHVEVRFSAPHTADEVIERLLSRCRAPGQVRVVSSDHSVRYAARRRRCLDTPASEFVKELCAHAVVRPPPKPNARKGTGKRIRRGEAVPEEAQSAPSDTKKQDARGSQDPKEMDDVDTKDWLIWFGL